MLKYAAGEQGEPISAEQVGAVIARMAQYFAGANARRAQLQCIADKKAAEIYSGDENGKPISAAKAKILMDATLEAQEHLKAKTDIENIEQYINALKYLQKGILNEYSHMSA